MIFVFLLIIFFSLFSSSCAPGGGEKQCYHVIEKDTETTLVLEINQRKGKTDFYPDTITIIEKKKGKMIAEPFSQSGRVEGNRFIRVDGTGFEFDDAQLKTIEPDKDSSYPKIKSSSIQSSLAGIVFTKAECP